MDLRSLSVVAASCIALGQGASAQVPGAAQEYDVPFAPVHSVPLTQSLPRLIAEGWQIAAVSYSTRTFAYHLVKDGALALCLSELGRVPFGSECIQLVDGAAPASGTSPPPR
ncbi:hypothetical protein [Roseomonas chloroacetimidivorans]|jgi:hypothetical protein|uniref:hypothetical protein n=1 Tax=Roseomonas chloroacetimidivorans TaxID=1766656 RepID=UPI003C762F51